MTPITAVILAGGQSLRMGRDKAEILWQGETLLARTARVAREVVGRVLIIGRDRPRDWPIETVDFLQDTFPSQGPLGGLATALQAAGENVCLLACDMPTLSPAAILWLTGQTWGRHGTAVRRAERWEPLFSMYTPAVLPLVQERLEAGRRSLQSLIDAGEFHAVTAPPEVAAALVNVNTPEEFAKL